MRVPAVELPPDPADVEREARILEDLLGELRDELEAMRRKGRLRTGDVEITVGVKDGWARGFRLVKSVGEMRLVTNRIPPLTAREKTS